MICALDDTSVLSVIKSTPLFNFVPNACVCVCVCGQTALLSPRHHVCLRLGGLLIYYQYDTLALIS